MSPARRVEERAADIRPGSAGTLARMVPSWERRHPCPHGLEIGTMRAGMPALPGEIPNGVTIPPALRLNSDRRAPTGGWTDVRGPEGELRTDRSLQLLQPTAASGGGAPVPRSGAR